MQYLIIPTDIFIEQVKDLDFSAKELIKTKKELLKLNPFRFKHLTCNISNTFVIKFRSRNSYKRLIYMVRENKVILCFILNRSSNYSDLDKYFKKLNLTGH